MFYYQVDENPKSDCTIKMDCLLTEMVMILLNSHTMRAPAQNHAAAHMMLCIHLPLNWGRPVQTEDTYII